MKAVAAFLTGLGAFAIATWAIFGQPPNQDDADAGVEVQARGPMHEAFAQPTEQKQEPSALIAKKPPEPIEEMPPDQKPAGEDVQWIPGYWAWDDDRSDYLWVSGIWRVPLPGRRWIPGYWNETTGGWQWVSGYWGPIAESVEVYPEPPEPVNEAIAPPPNADTVYVPGIWIHHETRFVWRPGHWIGMRPGWVWMPARYCWTPAGYCFVQGCWDYDLDDRGMCFAPIYLNPRVARPNWIYRPRHIVRTNFLLGSLFVNLGRHHYYFGDYYDGGYARRGYVPWIDYRIRNNSYDPIFSYYRWQNRGQPRWEADTRAVFINRRDNQNARPPRTFALQEKAPGQNQVRAVASFEQAKTAGVKLASVSKAQVTAFHANAVEIRNIGVTRNKIERSPNAKAPKGAPAKLELPKTTIKTITSKKAPPEPETPKIQEGAKDKLPKVEPPNKDKLPKVEPPNKDKLPKVEPPKDKLPKVEPPKDKLPKVEPPKDKLPKVEPPNKDKLPKVEPPHKDKLPKVEPPKKDHPPKNPGINDKNPMDGSGLSKDQAPKKDDSPKDQSPKKDDSPNDKKPKDKSPSVDQVRMERTLKWVQREAKQARFLHRG